MTTVAFIGSGDVGSALARLAVEAGHQVVLSNSCGPETLAAAAGDIIVVTVRSRCDGSGDNECPVRR